MNRLHSFVVFLLDDRQYALPLQTVERIVQIVDIDPLRQAPEIILGLINVQGRIVPVVDARKRFQLPAREVELSDRLIIATTPQRTVALIADSIFGVVECSDAEITRATEIAPGLHHIERVAKLPSGLVLIHDLTAFLSLDENETLDAALDRGRDER